MDVLYFFTARALDLNGSGGRRFNVKQAMMAYRTIDYMIHKSPSLISNICSGSKISNFLDYVNNRIKKLNQNENNFGRQMKTFMIYSNNVERDTMMQEEIDNEHLICISGVVPVKPAKYNVLEI